MSYKDLGKCGDLVMDCLLDKWNVEWVEVASDFALAHSSENSEREMIETKLLCISSLKEDGEADKWDDDEIPLDEYENKLRNELRCLKS